jgi:hypothetical protein
MTKDLCYKISYTRNLFRIVVSQCLSLPVTSALIFAVKAGAYHCSKGNFLALPANIRIGQKRLTLINTPAYNDTKLIMAVKTCQSCSYY